MRQTYFPFMDDQSDIGVVDQQITPFPNPADNPQSAPTDAGIRTDNPITPHPLQESGIDNETIGHSTKQRRQ
jgi:hypothetical protein